MAKCGYLPDRAFLPLCKIHRKIGYIYAVRAAQLDVGNAEPGKNFDLAV